MKLWQTVDNIIHHLVHTMNTPSLNSIQSVLNKLPEEIQQSIQCIQAYQNRKTCSSLQSLQSDSPLSKHGSKSSLSSKRSSKSSLSSKRDSKSSLTCKRDSRGSISSINKPNQSKSVTFSDCSGDQSSSFYSSNASANQNRTIVLNKLGNSSNNASGNSDESGVNDRTVILSQNLSDSKNESARSSVCSQDSLEASKDSYSLPRVESCRYSSNKSPDESNDSNQSSLSECRSPSMSHRNDNNSRNINITEEKAMNYNQNKVGSQLKGPSRKKKCESVYDNMPEQDFGLCGNSDVGMVK